jgi:DHA1 family tetracycline resistance protein-like MFS transporter
MLLTGLAFGTMGYVIYALADTGAVFWLGIPVFGLMGLYGPSAQGLMTRYVSVSEQGQLQGINSSFMGMTGIFGPALFTLTFAEFIGPHAGWHLPGAPFLLAALLLAVAWVIAWRVTRDRGTGC